MYSNLRRILLPLLGVLTAVLLVLAISFASPIAAESVLATAEGNMTVTYAGDGSYPTTDVNSEFNDTEYRNHFMIPSSKIASKTANGGERANRSLNNAFDNNSSTYWFSQQPNTADFKNHIIVNFTEKFNFRDLLYKSSFYTPNDRYFSGYPTTLNIYTANGNDNFTLAGTCISEPQRDQSEIVVFSLPEGVRCDRIKIEFYEVSVYNNTETGSDAIAVARDLLFFESSDGIYFPRQSTGNHANTTYLAANSVNADEMKIRANGGGIATNAFDKDTTTYWQTESYNTDIFTNKLTLTMNKNQVLGSIVYSTSYYTRDDGRHFSGFPTVLTVTATQENGTQTMYTFRGAPGNEWKLVDFVFPEPVSCKTLELEFTEVTTFAEVASGNPVVVSGEIYLLKTTNATTEELLAEINSVFTDYAQYELKAGCDADYLAQLRARARENPGYENALKPVLDRAAAIVSGAMRKDPYREFSTAPNAKNPIEQYGDLAGYCQGTLNMSSFGTNRQVIGIGGATGETITIYVEADEGDPLPSIAFTQIYGDWRSWMSTRTLQRGKNEFTFPNFKTGNYSQAVSAGGPIHIINPYTPDQQSSNVKLYFEGGCIYPVFHDGDDEGTFKVILKDYYERLMDPNDSSVTVDAFEAITDNVILSCKASLAYTSYVSNGTSPQYNIDKWKKYTKDSLAFGGVEFDSTKPYYNPKNDHIRVNYRMVQPYAGYYAFAAYEHVGIIDSATFPAMVQKWTVGWAFYHEMGHQLDNRRMMIGEVTNNMWSIFNVYMIDGSIADRINVSRVSASLASDFGGKVKNYYGNGNDNCDFWWILEGACPGYWARLQQLYNFEYTQARTDPNHPVTDTTELLCYFSSLAMGTDVSNYFERWGFYFTGSTKFNSGNRFTYEKTSQQFKDAMAAAKAEGRITREGKKFWYVNNGQYRYQRSHGNTMSEDWAACYNTSQVINPTKIMGSNGSYTLLLPDPQKPEAHLCYEIQGYIDGKWQVLGVTDGTSFSDSRNYGSATPQYRVYAYDRYFNHTGDPTAVSPETATQTNVCRIGDTYYNSLHEATAAVNNSSAGSVTIYLLKDFEDNNIRVSRDNTIIILPDPAVFSSGDSVKITKNASGPLINMVWQATLGSDNGAKIILDGGSFSQNGPLISTRAGQRSRIVLNNVTLQNNINTGNGGGIYSENGTYMDYYNVTIKDNRAANGGAIYTTGHVDIRFYGLTLTNNTATGNGGGLYAGNGNANIVCQQVSNSYPEVIISGNKAVHGGGIYAEKTVTLNNVKILNNTATGNGGGVYTAINNTDKYISLTSCTLENNTAVNGSAIYMNSGSTRVAGCTVKGGIYKYYGASTPAKFELRDALSDFSGCEIRVSKTIPIEGLILCEVVTGITPEQITEPAKEYNIYNGRAEFVHGTGIVVYPVTATVTINYDGQSIQSKVPFGEYVFPDRFDGLSEGKYVESYAVDGKTYAIGAKITVTGDFTATATVKDLCNVTLVYGTYTEKFTCKQGYVYYLPMKTKDNEVVFGWDCSDSNYYAYAEGVEIVRNTVFNAVIKRLHTVTMEIAGVETSAEYEYNGSVTLSSPPAIFGKVFSHWEIDGAKYQPNQTLKVTGDIYAVAVYTDTWTVTTVTASGETTDARADGFVINLQGAAASLGREFKYWLIDGVKYYSGSSYTVHGDCEIVAVYAQVNPAAKITVTLVVNKGRVVNDDGTVSDEVVEDVTTTAEYAFNATYTFPSAPAVNKGNTFKYWVVNGIQYAAGAQIKVTDAFTVTAVVERSSAAAQPNGNVTVTVKDYSTGTLTTKNYDYAVNTVIYLTQPSGKYQGKVFSHWMVNGIRYESGANYTVTETATIEAIYDTAYTVSLTQLENGKEITTSDEYGNSRVYTLSVPKNAGRDKIFSHWEVNGDKEHTYKPGDTFTVSGNTTVKAVYNDVEKVTFVFKYLGSNGLVEESATDNIGESYTLNAPEYVPDGKVFEYWDVNGVRYYSGSKLILLEDTNIEAVYSDVEIPPVENDGETGGDEGNGEIGGKRSNAGLIVGIVIAVIAVIVGGAVAAFFIIKKKKATDDNGDEK